MKFVVGIDASRNRSGGGIRHLVGILGAGDPREHGVTCVHVWAHHALLDALPDAPWLVRHGPPQLRGSLLRQMWWQRHSLPHEARSNGVDILLNTDAGTVCRFLPSVTMSRDMTQYEPGEMARYSVLSRAWMRNVALRYVQVASLRHASGALFLTRYASSAIQRYTGVLPNVAIVPHGVSDVFRNAAAGRAEMVASPVRCLYVSQAEVYKHQWHVVRAVAELRRHGHNVTLTLAGGGAGPAQERLLRELELTDPRQEFVTQIGFVHADKLPTLLAEADVFVFASSCENMPNTLVEGMAAGLPIACSDRGPMPEVLRDGGVYFDPEAPASIAAAIESLLVDRPLRERLARRASELAAQYSWRGCAAETWAFLRKTCVKKVTTSAAA